jgi:hypothetical protein
MQNRYSFDFDITRKALLPKSLLVEEGIKGWWNCFS